MVRVIVFNATFNNISVISWRSVLLVEDIRQSNRICFAYLIMLEYDIDKVLY